LRLDKHRELYNGTMFLRLNRSSSSRSTPSHRSTERVKHRNKIGALPLLDVVATVARELVTSDLELGLSGALRALRAGAQADRVYVIRYNAESASGVLIAEHCAPSIPEGASSSDRRPDPFTDFQEMWTLLMEGKTYGSRRAEKNDAHLTSNLKGSPLSDHLVPIFVNNVFWGVLGLDNNTTRRAFSEQENQALSAVSAIIAAAIARHQSEEELHSAASEHTAQLQAEILRAQEAKELNQLLEGIVAASRVLMETPSLEDALQSWLANLARAVDADHARLGGFPLPENKSSTAFVIRVWSKSDSIPDQIPDTQDIREWVQRLHEGNSIWAHREDLVDPDSVKFWEESKCYTALIVPVVTDGRTVAWLCFDWSSRREWKESYRTLLRTAADCAAAAISRHEVLRRLFTEREDLTRANRALRRAIGELASLSKLDLFLTDMLRESIAILNACEGNVTLLDGQEILQDISIDREGAASSETASNDRGSRPSVPPELLTSLAALEPDQIVTESASLTASNFKGTPPTRAGVVSVTLIPLRVGSMVLGWMQLGSNIQTGPSPDKVALLRVLADQMTLAVQFSRLAKEAQASATRSAVLSERNRLARDLHDTLAQGFAGVIAQLGAVEGAIELKQWDRAAAYFERAKQLARFSLAEARSSVHALRPETNAGPLRDRLEHMVSLMTRGTPLASDVEESGEPVDLAPTADWCAYKFVQEALANAVKHSGANRFSVRMTWHKELIEIYAIDNGQGFDPDKVREGLGFLSMRERAYEAGGSLRHEIQPGGGTRLRLEVPIR
jgi:signal transduction histidine kinase